MDKRNRTGFCDSWFVDEFISDEGSAPLLSSTFGNLADWPLCFAEIVSDDHVEFASRPFDPLSTLFPLDSVDEEAPLFNPSFPPEPNGETQVGCVVNSQDFPSSSIGHSMMISSNPQNPFHIMVDASTLTGPPPDLSLSSSSSSSISSANTASTTGSAKRPEKRSALSRRQILQYENLISDNISNQKLEVLEHAFQFDPTPSEDDALFLAQSLQLDAYTLANWCHYSRLDARHAVSGQRQVLNTKKVAVWKQHIINRVSKLAKPGCHPTESQINFLTAGLRITVDQYRQSVTAYEEYLRKSKEGKQVESKHPSPPVSSKVPAADLSPATTDALVVKTTAGTDRVSRPVPPIWPAANLSLLDSDPWNQLKDPIARSNGTHKADLAKAHVQRYQEIVTEMVASWVEKDRGSNSDVGTIQRIGDIDHATQDVDSNIDDSDTESSFDEDVSTVQSLEEEVATILGPVYAHLTQYIIDKFSSNTYWDLSQFDSSPKQCPNGEGGGSTPSSSQTPANASSPNTTASDLSGTKRKSSGGGGGGGGDDPDDDPEDPSGNRNSPPIKRARKTPQPRFDCPISRKSSQMGSNSQFSTSHVCAPDGMEIRLLWAHLRKAHYGCEKCGLQLNGSTSDAKTVDQTDKRHLMLRQDDSSICKAKETKSPFPIGLNLWSKFELIYGNAKLTPAQKWVEWWKLLYPEDLEISIPDPHHQSTFVVSAASIPAYQSLLQSMWNDTPILPALDDIQQEALANLLDKVLRTSQIMKRIRKTANRKKNNGPSHAPLSTMGTPTVAHAAGPSTAYNTFAQGQNPFATDLDDLLNANLQSTGGNDGLNRMNYDDMLKANFQSMGDSDNSNSMNFNSSTYNPMGSGFSGDGSML